MNSCWLVGSTFWQKGDMSQPLEVHVAFILISRPTGRYARFDTHTHRERERERERETDLSVMSYTIPALSSLVGPQYSLTLFMILAS